MFVSDGFFSSYINVTVSYKIMKEIWIIKRN